MVSFRIGVGIGTLLAVAGLAALPLSALTMQECSAAFRDARKSGSLGKTTWLEFRKEKCNGIAPKPGPATGLPASGSGYLSGSKPVFPAAVSSKYSDETPGKARRQTCLDQYKINKTGNTNGGLKWIQRGGGYYSECNKRLKAAGKG